MAVQTPFFGKQRDADTFGARQPASHGASTGLAAAGALPVTPPAAAAQPAGGGQAAPPAGAREGGSKLTVGPNIKLKGVEITDCDTLVVEGLVEATMDSRLMQIAQQGAFKGSAEIDIAEIHGEFDGSLTVRQKLVIHATGKVTGKIRYGKVVIEEGGQLSGEIEFGTAGATKGAAAAKPGLHMAAV
jgi:cytoskeletal protein CcmA (bactofilin family)